jgi:hypothetical protein
MDRPNVTASQQHYRIGHLILPPKCCDNSLCGGASLTVHSGPLKPIAEPNAAAFEHLAAFRCHSIDRGRHTGLFIAGIENAWRALRAIHCSEGRQTDFVDESGAKEGAIRDAAAVDL